MMQFSSSLIALVLALSFYVEAAPLGSRQVGDLQCNIARLKTVSGLAATNKAVNALSSSSGSDPAVASAVTQAQSGIQSAQSGISTIAKAILTGQDAPADARNQVGSGLATAQSALNSIGNSSDPNLQAAQSSLSDTIAAGEQVVSDCGGGSSTSTGTPATGAAPSVATAPNAKRQVGDLQCNIARLKTVSSLAATSKSVQEIASAAGNDAATSSAAQAAASGLSTAQGGISQIAQALIAGQNAPASGRDQVGQGLTAAQNALNSITSTDPTVTSALSQAQTDLSNTITAGQQVTADCTPTGASAAAAKRQVGDLQCNLARLKAVSSLNASQKNVQAIGNAAPNDATTAAAVQSAQAGIASAQAGISQIAQALVQGQLAPASGRDQVNQGVSSAQSALEAITSTDPAVTSAVSTAQSSLTDTLNASAQVASDC